MIAIHADFPVRSGWHFEPDSGFCLYSGLTIFRCRMPGSTHIGFPQTTHMMFSFNLSRHAQRVCPPTPSHSQQQRRTPPADDHVLHGEPILAVPMNVISPHPSFHGGPRFHESMGLTSSLEEWPVFPNHDPKAGDARLYKRQFQRRESSDVKEPKTVPVPMPDVGSSDVEVPEEEEGK